MEHGVEETTVETGIITQEGIGERLMEIEEEGRRRRIKGGERCIRRIEKVEQKWRFFRFM